MDRSTQRQILLDVIDLSDIIADTWNEEFEETPYHVVLDLELSDEERSQLCEKYKTNLDAVDADEFEEFDDYLNAVTEYRGYYIPGIVLVIEDGYEFEDYPTLAKYAASCGVNPQDITIASYS